MKVHEILRGSKGPMTEAVGAKIWVLPSDGAPSGALAPTTAKSSVIDAMILVNGDDEFSPEVSQREISWAALHMLKAIATQLETIAKALPALAPPATTGSASSSGASGPTGGSAGRSPSGSTGGSPAGGDATDIGACLDILIRNQEDDRKILKEILAEVNKHSKKAS